MEPTQLQLVLNVITITGVTSLAGYCYLLKKENRKLASERRIDSMAQMHKADGVEAVVHLQSSTPARKPLAAAEQDIRTFASARRTRWVKNLSSN